MQWETVIGLEIHVQLATRSKIFSGALTAFGAAPNTQACAVDLGLPGILPVLNREAVNMAVKFGLAAHAEINRRSVFARKNYFYPDLPKGYQISQFEIPVVGQGKVDILLEDGARKTVGLTRAHLEEDAGKSLHEEASLGGGGMTGIDLNRAGTPLLEIVSDPDMRSAKEAVAYARKIYALVTYLGICDGNMQEGSFRMDANVSVRPMDREKLGTRTELKNLNSFRFLERAIDYEAERQIDVITDGGKVVQETRLYDADKHETRSMRSKEEANDYRYFPDPDLLPLVIDEDLLERIRDQLPELPDARQARYQRQYGLTAMDAAVLAATRATGDFFEEVLEAAGGEAKLAANWIIGELSGHLNKANETIRESPVSAEQLGGLIRRIADHTISGKIAKDVFEALWNGEGAAADEVIEAKGLRQITDTGALEAIVDAIIADHPSQVEQYRAGKQKVFGFFVGQAMKATKGKANPAQVNALLKEKLLP